MDDELLLNGLDGANPLGFLTLLGCVCFAARFAPDVRVRWRAGGNGWRPVISRVGLDGAAFAARLHTEVVSSTAGPFKASAKLPFARDVFRHALLDSANRAEPKTRHFVDLLAGFGSDAFVDEKGEFDDTAFRLVRSGDAAGQGLPRYVLAARDGLSADSVLAVLFERWRYDDECFSLRWDPVEDQRYALRADDPSKGSNKRAGSRGVRAANALAAEALALLPVQPQRRQVVTTGFAAFGRRVVAFTWPLWSRPCGIDVIRSLLADPQLSQATPDSKALSARGIPQVFRAERVAPNQYYKNFVPAQPV